MGRGEYPSDAMSLEQFSKACNLNANPFLCTVTFSELHVQEHAPGVVSSVCLKDSKDKVSWLFFAF